MNIKLCVWARKKDYIDEMHYLFKGAVGYIREFSDSENEVILNNGQYAVYNSNNLDLCFKTSLVRERDGVIVSSSEPLICLDEVVQSEKDYTDFIFNATKDQDNYKKIFPKYFASRISSQGMEIFNDLHGFSRCYMTMNDKFVAVSNHMGVLAYFIDDVLEINNYGIHMYAQTAWYCKDTTAYKLINRVGPGTVITCRQDCVTVGKWHNMADLVSPNGKDFDVDNITAEWDIVIRNLSSVLQHPPAIELSGGRDSRVVAAAWLSTKKPCIISTFGIVKQEADTASRLINAFPGNSALDSLGMSHKIYTSTSSGIRNKQNLEDRIRKWLMVQDSEIMTDRVRSDILFKRFSNVYFSGLGGEISKGVYYKSDNVYKKTLENKYYFENNINNYVTKNCKTDLGLFIRDIVLGDYRKEFLTLGLDRFNMHDYFYYRDKFCRWSGANQHSNCILIFCSPSYVRESFNASPDAKRSGVILKQITERLIPEWKDIPYYSLSNADSKAFSKAKTRIWQNDPEFVKSIIQDGNFYPVFFDRAGILEYYDKCINNEGQDYEQTILLMALITEMLWKHYNKLAYRVNKHRHKYYYNIAQKLKNQPEKTSIIDVENSELSVGELYEVAEQLWKERNYKGSVLMHRRIYDLHNYSRSAYRCGVAYFKGYGVEKNINIAASYLFISALDNHRYAIFYRGLILIDKFYNYYHFSNGVKLIEKSHELGVKEAQEILKNMM